MLSPGVFYLFVSGKLSNNINGDIIIKNQMENVMTDKITDKQFKVVLINNETQETKEFEAGKGRYVLDTEKSTFEKEVE